MTFFVCFSCTYQDFGFSLGHHGGRQIASNHKVDFPEATLISTSTVSSTNNPGHTEKTDIPDNKENQAIICTIPNIYVLITILMLSVSPF